MIVSRRTDCKPYVTKDGSTIRELMHPDIHRNHRQSLAEATVGPGQQTVAHKHLQTEELYFIKSGAGVILVGEDERDVMAGDTVAIPPGTVHSVRNTGDTDLVILCACSPPYSHDDTVLVDSQGQ